MQKGSGLISLIITIAIIGIIVYGAWYFSKGGISKNDIQQDQSEIQSAKDAANEENQYNQSIQDQAQSTDNGGVNYRSVEQQIQK